MSKHTDLIKQEFEKQADNFESYQSDIVKQKFMADFISKLSLQGNERVIEIAAGTCALGRLIADKVGSIVELDVTEKILEVGMTENTKAGITNAEYVVGTAENTPFLNSSFDIAVSRLAFHHFESPQLVMNEIKRITADSGKVGIIDMIPISSVVRDSFDYYERLRDPSHTRCLTEDEIKAMLTERGFKVTHTFYADFSLLVDKWLSLTSVNEEIRTVIINDIYDELNGGSKTGLSPFVDNDELYMIHRWAYIIAQKTP